MAAMHVIRQIRQQATIWLIVMSAVGCASRGGAPTLPSPAVSWEAAFEHPVAFQRLVGQDLLVVGTTRHLYGLDPVTGRQIWRMRNVNATRSDIVDLVDSPYFLIADATGGAFDDAGTHVLAVDRLDGSLHWESPVIPGRVLQARIDYANHRVFAATVRGAHGDDRGLLSDVLPNKGLFSGLEREPSLLAMDLVDGRILWQRDLNEEVQLRPSYRAGVEYGDRKPFDLGLYHPPLLMGRKICVTYAGIACFDADSGQPAWSLELDVIDDDLALSYPEPIVSEDMIIAGDEDRLYALDPQNGERLWRSEKFGRMPELLDDDGLIYVQIGGRYFDLDDEEWVSSGGFGVAAVNKRNGRTLWEYPRVRRSITNLLSIGPYVWFADHQTLFALDRLDGTVAVQEPHRLGDDPNYVVLTESNHIVLISESEAAGYSTSGTILWYEKHQPVGPGAWKRIAAGLMRASGAIFKLSSTVIAYGGGLLPSIPSITVGSTRLIRGKSVAEDSTGYLGERLSAKGEAIGAETVFANLTGRSQYFLTQTRGRKQVVLAAVDLESGATAALTPLPAETADLVVDEINGRVYQADGQRLVAVSLDR